MPSKTMFLISAQMQSGKDVFGEALRKACGGTVAALASPVKEVAIALVGMPSEVAYGGEKERRAWKRYCIDRANCPNATHEECSDAREWLQWVGTELGRMQIHTDLWVHRLFERAQYFSSSCMVITDCRFENELGLTSALEDANKAVGGLFRFIKIRLKRPGNENDDEHASEKEQMGIPDSSFDEVVVNDGTIGELEGKARLIANNYLAS